MLASNDSSTKLQPFGRIENILSQQTIKLHD